MATSELPRQGANLSANRVDFSSSATPASTCFTSSPHSSAVNLGGESVKETTWTNQHTALGCEGKKGEGKEKKRAEEKSDIPDPQRLTMSARQQGGVRRGRQQMNVQGYNEMVE